MIANRRTGIWAAVPIKSPTESKQRLAGILDGNERQQISLAMLSDVLAALHASTSIDQILIVTSDTRVRPYGVRFNTRILVEKTTQGQSAAAAQACRYAANAGARGILIVPSDVPLIRKETIDRAVDALQTESSMVIGPDRHGTGTNLLGLSPVQPFTFYFGDDSFQAHCRESTCRDGEPAVIRAPDIALDIDTPECLHLLMKYVFSLTMPTPWHTAECIKQLQTTDHLQLDKA